MINREKSIFFFTGVVATVLHFFIVVFLVENEILKPVFSNTMAFIFSNMAAYTFLSIYSYDREITLRNYAKYLTASMLSAGIIITGVYLGEYLGINYILSMVISLLVSPIVSYFLQHKFLWSKDG